MHPGALGYVSRVLFGPPPLPPRRAVVELGALDINGGVSQLFYGARPYVGVDLVQGPGVHVVADAATYTPDFAPDTVVCCEVLEHAENADRIVQNALQMLAPGGLFIMTCATGGRSPHSAEDGAALRDGEFYRNVTAEMFRYWCWPLMPVIEIDEQAGDLRAVVWKEEN
jgi:hypothetical protein